MSKTFYRLSIAVPLILVLALSALQTVYVSNKIVGQEELKSRVMEKLGRGLVALRISDNSVWLSWRLLATDPDNIMFNIYRRIGYGPLVKVNSEPLYLTWFIDKLTDFDFSQPVTYYVVSVIDGVEVEVSKPYTLNPGTPIGNYISIPLRQDALNFAGAVQGARLAGIGDLDGDGEYEIVVKRGDQDLDPSQASIPTHLPQETYKLEAYKLDGTFLWRVDLGRNIRPGVYYSPFVVYDLDGDGRAEVATMIGENATFYTRDGKVIVVGDVNNDGTMTYVNQLGIQTADPLYFVIIDGAAGYPLAFGEWLYMYNHTYWGDNYGNRACRNMIAVAYLDGELPSLIIARGIYTHIYVEAWNWRNGKLTKLWTFYLPNPGVSKGFQQMRVGDIDGDGRDEIVYGAIAIDDDGKLLWDSGLLHGDRFHIADIDPSRPGLEIFYVQERPGACAAGCRYIFVENGKNCTVVGSAVVCKPVSGEVTLYWRPGVALVEGATGKLIWAYIGSGISDQDIGRGSCGDVDPRYPGIECWATRPTAPGNLYNASGYIIGPRMNLTNFNIWWDGDLIREHLDVVVSGNFSVSKYDWTRRIWRHIFNVTSIIPGSRNAPLAYGDIIGDWREEFVVITADKKEMRVYISTEPTNHRIYTLMHDPQYRLDVAMQTHGYMQSNQLSFYLGTETTFPIPKPNIRYPEPKTVSYTLPAFPVMPWTPTVTYTITTTAVQTTTVTLRETYILTNTLTTTLTEIVTSPTTVTEATTLTFPTTVTTTFRTTATVISPTTVTAVVNIPITTTVVSERTVTSTIVTPTTIRTTVTTVIPTTVTTIVPTTVLSTVTTVIPTTVATVVPTTITTPTTVTTTMPTTIRTTVTTVIPTTVTTIVPTTVLSTVTTVIPTTITTSMTIRTTETKVTTEQIIRTTTHITTAERTMTTTFTTTVLTTIREIEWITTTIVGVILFGVGTGIGFLVRKK